MENSYEVVTERKFTIARLCNMQLVIIRNVAYYHWKQSEIVSNAMADKEFYKAQSYAYKMMYHLAQKALEYSLVEDDI